MKDLQNSPSNKPRPDFGRSFICIPRRVLTRVFQGNKSERQLWHLYFILLVYAYHSDSYVRTSKGAAPCQSGEYIGTLRDLSELSGIPRSSLARLLGKLSETGYIEILSSKPHTHISIIDYHLITRGGTKRKASSMTPGQALAAYEERLMKGIVYG